MREAALLEIKVVEGHGEKHSTGTRAYKGISVLVSDEEGAPVPNARVVFRMPETGPGGRFANGLPEEASTTDLQGRTSAWGVQWNGVPGECRISIFASRGKVRAGTTASVTLTGAPIAEPATFAVEAPPPKLPPAAPRRRLEPRPTQPQAGASVHAPPPGALRRKLEPRPAEQQSAAVHAPPVAKRPGVTLTRTTREEESIPGSRNKWLLIALSVGGAVGGGLLYQMSRQKTAAPGTVAPSTVINPTPVRPTIGNPIVTIGRP